MKISTKLIKLLLCLPLAAVWLSSCVSSSTEIPDTPLDPTEAVFNMTIPGSSTTRALTETDEYKVSDADVIVFNNATGELLYTAYGLNTIVQSGNTTVRFTVKLREVPSVSAYDFMIVANARNILGALGSLSGTITKTHVQAALIEQVTAGTGWVATNTLTGYKDMPMWGELKNQTIAAKNYAANLTRMTVKADVEVDLSGGSLGDQFLLKEVWLYNYNASGYLVPAAANWGAPSASDVPAGDDLHERALRPTVPTGVLQTGTATAIDYTSAISSDELSLKDCIYLFESAAGSTAAYMNNTCLVIRADWTPNGGTTQTGWYRMDFANTNLTTLEATYLPLRRNHRYNMKITRISGPGYGSKEEAYNSLPANIINGVVEWDESGLGSQTTDGQYTLSAPDELTFYAEGNGQDIRVYTDNPNGWKVLEKSAWITLSPDQSTTEYTTVTVSCDPMTLPNTDRAGYFVIEVGRIRKTVVVNQLAEPELTLDVDKLFLGFKKTPSVALPVNVTTYPSGVPLYFSTSGTIEWDTNISSYDGATDAGSPFYFKPKVNNTGSTTLSSMITISAILDGKIVSKAISVTQSPYDLTFTVTPYNPYPAAGGVQKLSVLSEPDWYVSSITNDASSIISSWSNTTVTGNGTTPVDYNFTLAANPTFAEREATFNFGSTDPDFPGTKSVTIRQSYTNPSISITPNSVSWPNASYSAQSFTVTSNAQWKYTTSGQWSQAVSAASQAAGTTLGTQNAHTPTGTGITFTPTAYAAVSGTPAAGTSYTAYADFAATNLPGGVPGATTRLTITRTVPAHWAWASFSPASGTISRTAQNIVATVNTNAAWSLAGTHASTQNMTANTYASRSQTVSIPENTTWSSRTITVTASSSGFTNKTQTYTQPGYSMTFSAAGTAVGSGFTITVTGNGAGPQLDLRCAVNNVQISGSSVTKLGAANSGSRTQTVKVPNNPSTTATRSVQIQYYHPGEKTWKTIQTYTQPTGNIVLSTGRILAKADGPGDNVYKTMDWSWAMGLIPDYWTWTVGPGGFANFLTYTATEDKGCNAYYEKSDQSDKGLWKVPHDAELREFIKRTDIGLIGNDGYWGVNNDGTQARTMVSTTGEEYYKPKTQTSWRVRCVRPQ